MNLKSYLHDRAPKFAESEIAPIHVADLNGRHYYAFTEDIVPPPGGKAVSNEDLEDVVAHSLLIRQIKEEVGRRVAKIAPTWRQQNALADLYLLGGRTDLNDEEQKAFTESQALLTEISRLRKRSNAIEDSFLQGIAVDYTTDQAWEAS